MNTVTAAPEKGKAAGDANSIAAPKTNEGAELLTRDGTEFKHISFPSIVFNESENKFWVKTSGDSWVSYSKQDLIDHLWCKGGTKSEAAEAVERIKQESRVSFLVTGSAPAAKPRSLQAAKPKLIYFGSEEYEIFRELSVWVVSQGIQPSSSLLVAKKPLFSLHAQMQAAVARFSPAFISGK